MKKIILLIIIILVIAFIVSLKANNTNDFYKGILSNKNLSEQEKELFVNKPAASSTKENIADYINKSVSLAEEGTEVFLNKCDSSPAVLKTTEDKKIIFTNTGDTKLFFSINKNNYEIGSGESITIDAKSLVIKQDFDKEFITKTTVLTHYFCGESDRKNDSGIIVIVP